MQADSTAARSAFSHYALWALIGLPVLSLALQAIAWLRFGIDLPFFDDWRAYTTGQIDSLDPAYLFIALNDTLAPVGYTLDALAQRYLDGNSIAYQFLSMVTVLGFLLLFQWKLLHRALGDRLQAGWCFLFTLLMLQPGSYWGRENLAYHQGLPLVFILAALWFVLGDKRQNHWRLLAIFLLGALAGLTYISGAFGALAAGAGVVVVAWMAQPSVFRTQLLRGGTALALAGAATSTLQFVKAVLPTLGATHHPDARLALPIERDFWLFYLGKIGRSLLLPGDASWVPFTLVVLVCLGLLLMALLLLRRIRRGANGPHLHVAVVLAAVGACVFIYLLLVAAGRTHLRPAGMVSGLDVFAYGFLRFHFFWATLLWPWTVAAAIVLLRGRYFFTATGLSPIGVFVPVIAGLLMAGAGAFKHFRQQHMEAFFRKPTIVCLAAQLQRGEGIDCPEFNMPDLVPAYLYASRIKASFIKYFPIPPIDLGVDDPVPLFRLDRDPGHVQKHNIAPGQRRTYQAGVDSQISIAVPSTGEMANCAVLDVRGILNVERAATAQLFFRPLGQAEFSQASSRTVPISEAVANAVFSFRIESETGFEAGLRLDPVIDAQQFDLPELEVRCRLRKKIEPFLEVGHIPSWVDRVAIEPMADVVGGYRAAADGRFVFKTGKPQEMNVCRVLEFEAVIRPRDKDRAQIFFQPLGATEFSEQASVSLPVYPGIAGQRVVFRLESAIGFEDFLRFDPVQDAQNIRVSAVKIRCRRYIEPTARSK